MQKKIRKRIKTKITLLVVCKMLIMISWKNFYKNVSVFFELDLIEKFFGKNNLFSTAVEFENNLNDFYYFDLDPLLAPPVELRNFSQGLINPAIFTTIDDDTWEKFYENSENGATLANYLNLPVGELSSIRRQAFLSLAY